MNTSPWSKYNPGSLSFKFWWWITHPLGVVRKFLGVIYFKLFPSEPWISPGAAGYLRAAINPKSRILEWGSGRSTIWFSQQCGHIKSVEHHPEWFEAISKKLDQKNLVNVEYRLIGLDHDESIPAPRIIMPLPSYVRAVEEDNDPWDIVLVDGHYRLACVKAAIDKIKPGGLLVIDNSDWMPLSEWQVPNEWSLVHQSLGFESQTTIWQKPLSNTLLKID